MEGRMLLPLFLFLALAIIGAAADPQGPLIRSVFLHRHGDRSPTYNPPSVSEEKIKQLWHGLGRGQLTGLGMSQVADLGAWLADRYRGTLLPASYGSGDSYRCRSTDVDRTLMSAQSAQSKLFPDGSGPTVNLDGSGAPALADRAQPVPVHMEPTAGDRQLLGWDLALQCPAVVEDMSSGPLPGILKAADASNATLFARAARAAGEPGFSILNVTGFADFLFCSNQHGMGDVVQGLHPGDAAALFRNTEWLMSTILAHSEKFVQAATWPVGLYVRDLLLRTGRPLNHLSGHDTTVVPLLHALGIFDGKQPKYSASVVLELRGPAGKRGAWLARDGGDPPGAVGATAAPPLSALAAIFEGDGRSGSGAAAFATGSVAAAPPAGSTVTVLHDERPVLLPGCSAIACPVAEFESRFAHMDISVVNDMCGSVPNPAPEPTTSPTPPVSPTPDLSPSPSAPPKQSPSTPVVAVAAGGVGLFAAAVAALIAWRRAESRAEAPMSQDGTSLLRQQGV